MSFVADNTYVCDLYYEKGQLLILVNITNASIGVEGEDDRSYKVAGFSGFKNLTLCQMASIEVSLCSYYIS